MDKDNILITSPSLDNRFNISGISSVCHFIIKNNPDHYYQHFELGRRDNEKRNISWALALMQTMFRWISVAGSRKISIIHFNVALSKASVLRDAPLMMYARLIRKKMIIHVHGGEYLLKKRPPVWMIFLLKRAFNRKIPVIVLSPQEKDVISETFGNHIIRILPNCVDQNSLNNLSREFNPYSALKLLFLGRVHADKGIESIYAALSRLKSLGVPFSFYLAGTGPQEKEYVEKFTALLGDDFTFCGIVSGNAKISLLRSCDIFLLPSLYEGLPMALLEAMSCGTVPVVTNIGSMEYVVKNGENGIVLGSDPCTEIVSAILTLSGDKKLLAKMSSNAYHYILDHFNPKEYIVNLNEIYDIA